MPLTAIAIDDEPQALDVIRLHAAKVSFLHLEATFTDAFEAITYLQTHRADLIFLDIKMPDISGVDVVKCLPRNPMVIFTTAYSDYAVQGFELDAVDYLLKPFSLARFLKACMKALDIHTLRSEEDPFIFVKTGYEEEKVRVDDILYLEADGNYLSFVLPTRRLLSRQTMTDALQLLPPGLFVRVHRSYAIAIRKIEKIARQEITVAGGAIPIGASYERTVADIRASLNLP
ncbi:LytR/AlgR family response regulator transcription factor [Spirosoma sp. KUDC1026]|uniref:LytR/AlgR family response regulator transcription factor n=1 Tax=Spirosoma sp. KUDC1026 TaxID=2745947 RepID=UPI00159BAC8B|nr:LytTR family DNA-binding domain-containing protein [Spirosoma sp. KUDC1026]QKZ12821.1 response regulator transcription factor [Spirosoma sp. KUDC1026]